MKDLEILVNKNNKLIEDYIPCDLINTDENENNFHDYINPNLKPCIRKILLKQYIELRNYAKEFGHDFIVGSGYRSYSYQQQIWDSYVDEIGLEKTIQRVAPPGASEHQTGLAIDFAAFTDNKLQMDLTEEQINWLKSYAHYFGFILRYPQGKENITGYGYEPWHYRYIGTDISLFITKEQISLEEYKLLLK